MPSTKVKPLGYEDRLSIVDHLDELRSRLIVCIVTVIFCFAFTYWQNNAILKIVNRPFTEAKDPTKGSNFGKKNGGTLAQANLYQRNVAAALTAAEKLASENQKALNAVVAEGETSPAIAKQLEASNAALKAFTARSKVVAGSVPSATPKPTTLGVTEPFLTTFTVAGYSALLIALPLILFQIYAFLLPAFSPQERRTAVPFMAMVPVLFVCGVVFGYYIALPRAVDFLLNFNADQFDILVGAQQYYKFSIVLLVAIGFLFQIPVAVLAITSLGILTPKQLSKNRGYIILGVAVIAAIATPTPDPITMLVTMAPLLVLFELSLLLSRVFYRRAKARPSRWDWDDEEDEDGDGDEDPDWPEDDDDPFGFRELEAEQAATTPSSSQRDV